MPVQELSAEICPLVLEFLFHLTECIQFSSIIDEITVLWVQRCIMRGYDGSMYVPSY